jgi:hypothetical protein
VSLLTLRTFKNVYTLPDNFDPIYSKIVEIEDRMLLFYDGILKVGKMCKKLNKKINGLTCPNCKCKL